MKFFKISLMLVLLVLLSGCAKKQLIEVPIQDPRLKTMLNESEARIKNLETELATQISTLDSTKANVLELQKNLKVKNRAIEAKITEIKQLTNRNDSLTALFTIVKERQKEIQTNLDSALANIEKAKQAVRRERLISGCIILFMFIVLIGTRIRKKR